MYKIAILDDDQEFCSTLECLLSNYFTTYCFTNTQLILKKIQSENYDLVLVDFSIISTSSDLGEQISNGADLIKHIKMNLKEPPILVLFTGWISNNSLEEGKIICPLADSFLAKDSGIEKILQELNRLLSSEGQKRMKKSDRPPQS